MNRLDESTQRVRSILVSAGAVLDEFHTYQNQELRCADTTCKWLADQQSGCLMATVSKLIFLCEKRSTLAEAVLTFPATLADAELIIDVELEVLLDDDIAAHMGRFPLSTAVELLSRFLWLIAGWPHKFLKAVLTEDLAIRNATVAEFRKDYATFELFKAIPDKDKDEERVLGRRLCQQVAVQHTVAALNNTPHGSLHPDVVDFSRMWLVAESLHRSLRTSTVSRITSLLATRSVNSASLPHQWPH